MNRKSLSLSLGIALLASLPAAAQTYTFKEVKYSKGGVTDTFTQLLGINNKNIVAGYHGASINKGFTYDVATNTFTDENYPGSVQTQVTGINNSATTVTVGFYVDEANHVRGFTDVGGTFTKIVDTMGGFNQLLGQNDQGQAAGYYSANVAGTTPDHPYVYDEHGGVFAAYTIPGAVGGAQATGINNSSQVVGFFIDSANNNHGWLLIQGTLTVLDFPGSQQTQALGLNNKGMVVGSYVDGTGNGHGFTYAVNTKKWTSIDDPNQTSLSTIVNGINDAGTLVGFWGVSPNNTGFVATP